METLSIAVGDPALAAKLAEDEDFMANFAAVAEAMGYAPKEKTEEKEPEKKPEKEPVYGLDKDTGVYDIEAGEQKQEETKQEETKQEESKQEEQKQEERETTPTAEDKETVENKTTENETAENKTTTIDDITEDQTEEELTTNADNQIPETGQGDGSILDTSQAGVDPPPDEGPPQIIGIIILERFEKSTEGVHVA